MNSDEIYMKRCFTLAQRGGKDVKSNPLVGAVIVHNDDMIGEGYHRELGGNHAEVNAIQSVKAQDIHKLKKATMYVSLEPCNHHGRTPPCVDAISKAEIPRIVISVLDPNPKMMGRSVEYLKDMGKEVKIGVLKNNGEKIIGKFKKVLSQRPFVTLKFAQSKDRIIGKKDRRILISGEESKIFTHKLRSEHDAILIGTNTAVIDNPDLTCRAYPGEDPMRIVLDRRSSIPSSHTLLADDRPTLIFTASKNYKIQSEQKTIVYIDEWNLSFLLDHIFKLEIYSVLVEGGAQLISSFVRDGAWDQAYVITSDVAIGEGIKAPSIQGKLEKKYRIGRDIVHMVTR